MTTKFSVLLLLAIFMCSHSEASKLRTTTMTLYFQDWSAGPNAAVIPITGLPGRLWSFFSFGTIFCTDDPITEGLDKASPEIGRAQGIYVTCALDGSNTHVLISIVFTNTKYNGSTLEVQGASRQIDNVREVSVVAGTGKFRYATHLRLFIRTCHLHTQLFSVMLLSSITSVVRGLL